jgi:putative CocE/NonD family hydrolase
VTATADRTTEVRIEFDVEAEMRDGVVLCSDVYRPGAAESRPGTAESPVVLIRTPYGRQFFLMDAVSLSRSGFVVVVQDVRGRGGSDGEWYPFQHEGRDGFDSVEWAARLPGSTGRIALSGASYMAMAAVLAAAEQPPSLAAVSAVSVGIDPRNGLVARDGAFELGLQASWQSFLADDVIARAARAGTPFAPDAIRRAMQARELGRDDIPVHPLVEFGGFAESGLSRYFPDVAAHFEEAAPSSIDFAAVDVERIQVPVLCVGGWYDIYTADVLDLHRRLRAAGVVTELVMGPWTHSEYPGLFPAPEPYPGSSRLDDRGTTLPDRITQWFARWLSRDGDEGAAVTWYTTGDNRWEQAPEWPPPVATSSLYLAPGGSLAPNIAPSGESRFSYDPLDPVPTLGGNLLGTAALPQGRVEQNPIEGRDDVLTFDGAVLTEPVTVSGPVSVEVWMSSTAPSTDLVARLCDVDDRGRSVNIVDGITRIRQLSATEPTRVVVDLWSTSHTFLPGHRIRLDVTSSSFPRWDPNLNTGAPAATTSESKVAEQAIWHGGDTPSRVTLPVREP